MTYHYSEPDWSSALSPGLKALFVVGIFYGALWVGSVIPLMIWITKEAKKKHPALREDGCLWTLTVLGAFLFTLVAPVVFVVGIVGFAIYWAGRCVVRYFCCGGEEGCKTCCGIRRCGQKGQGGDGGTGEGGEGVDLERRGGDDNNFDKTEGVTRMDQTRGSHVGVQDAGLVPVSSTTNNNTWRTASFSRPQRSESAGWFWRQQQQEQQEQQPGRQEMVPPPPSYHSAYQQPQQAYRGRGYALR